MAVHNGPSLIESSRMRFYVTDAPTDDNLPTYLKAIQGERIDAWVRCCEECTYTESAVTSLGISIHDLSFPDGEAPPQELIERWLALCFKQPVTIVVHCVAGLGRAPLLVAIALIESGMDAMDAVEYIRKRRRGAINRLQLQYLQEYKPVRRKNGCAVM